MITIPIFMLVLFVIWNNVPDLIESVGHFLVAHARTLKQRKVLYEELRNG